MTDITPNHNPSPDPGPGSQGCSTRKEAPAHVGEALGAGDVLAGEVGAVEIWGLRKSFGDNLVLDGIDLFVTEGTVFALLGPNGSGKPTTVQILTTLLAADEGTVRDSATMLRRDLRHSLRRPSMTISGMAVPVVFLLLFVGVFGNTLRAGLIAMSQGFGSYTAYLTPGIIVMTAGAAAAATAINVCMDMREGIIARIRTMGIA